MIDLRYKPRSNSKVYNLNYYATGLPVHFHVLNQIGTTIEVIFIIFSTAVHFVY